MVRPYPEKDDNVFYSPCSLDMSYRCDTPGFTDSDTRAISARWEPDPVRYAITGLYVDRMQRLWVATGRGEGSSPVFEVFDTERADTNPDDYSKVMIINIED